MSQLEAVALANKDYVAEQYRRYQADPSAVDEQWRLFFAGVELATERNGAAQVAGASPAAGSALEIADLVHSYRELGHLVAHLNPLGPPPAGHPLLAPSEFGFTEADFERVVECASFRGCAVAPLGDLIRRL